jgi:hypothetical protein
MDIDREALEGIFEFFQVAYKSMVYFVNFQHISFLSELTFCTTILVHHVSIHGGATGKSYEGWMGPILMGTHVAFASHHVLPYVVVPHGSHVRNGCDLIQWEPTVASVSRHVLPYMDVPHCEYARQGCTPFKR